MLGHARQWWQFAISALCAPIARRMKRERSAFVSARAKLLVQYVDLYAKMLCKHEIKVTFGISSILYIYSFYFVSFILLSRKYKFSDS